jgi:hypothetical protein
MVLNTLRGSASHVRGARNELLVADYFLSLGWEVYLPLLTQSRADLIISKGRRCRKVQVKTVTHVRTGKYTYGQARLSSSNERQDKSYKVGDFDLIVFVDNKSNCLYIATFDEVSGLVSICFGSDNENPRKEREKLYDVSKWKRELN